MLRTPQGRTEHVAELLDRCLDLVTDELSPTTLQGYRRLAAARIVSALGSIEVRKLTAAQLDTF